MKVPSEWLSPPDLKTASRAQIEIAAAADRTDRIAAVALIAGVDTSMKWRDTRGPIHAAVAPLRWPGGEPLDPISTTLIPPMPYIPGYLGFRECPSLIAALDRMERAPDLILVDGHGISHPRRCGIATHLGVVTGIPTIGVAKSLLCGRIEGTLDEAAGSTAPLVDRDEQVGVAMRTRRRANPIYVSTGHRVSLDSAVEWVSRLCDGRRLPITTRLAHDAANERRRAWAVDQS
ncbi:deoxyribonuclease V [Stakelama marina]|uniref:Endonuclease V n=1 Tax=Stakelama marina TaxID=2826939 RepID=A0A8T4IIE6_9SPHN|nr:deoxyribonuclease V [Stakelama marina]MBR0553812.1 deoxyribonuclease V [Stakelama marina]